VSDNIKRLFENPLTTFSDITANSISQYFALGKISLVDSIIFQFEGILIEIFSVSVFISHVLALELESQQDTRNKLIKISINIFLNIIVN
jgi:hypothetical protein